MDLAPRAWIKGTEHNLALESCYFNVAGGPPRIAWRRDIRFPLFRYTKRKYANDFFSEGKIRLTPLLTYRKEENFNEAIGDCHEGQIDFRAVRDGVPCGFRVAIYNQWTISTSEERNDELMMEAFEADCCFRINSIDFFLEINARMEAECRSCLIDRVVYIPEDQWAVDLDALPTGATVFGGLFKRKRHAYQREVRPLWESRESPHAVIVGDESEEQLEQILEAFIASESARISPIDLIVPQAVPHCTFL